MFDRLNTSDITLAFSVPPLKKEEHSNMDGHTRLTLNRSQSRLEEMMKIDGMVRGLVNGRDEDKIQEDKQFIEEWYKRKFQTMGDMRDSMDKSKDEQCMTGKLQKPLEEITNNRRRHESYTRSGEGFINASYDSDIMLPTGLPPDKHKSTSTKA